MKGNRDPAKPTARGEIPLFARYIASPRLGVSAWSENPPTTLAPPFFDQAMMPSFYRGEPEHTDIFVRLKLSLAEYEVFSTDLENFISRSVLVKLRGASGCGDSAGGGALGELRKASYETVRTARESEPLYMARIRTFHPLVCTSYKCPQRSGVI